VPGRATWTLVLLTAVLAAVVAMRILPGSNTTVAGQLMTPSQRANVVQLRQQRAMMGMVVGAGLAVAGVLLQSLLRNPLASPDLLGLASGAGLAVILTGYAAGSAGTAIGGSLGAGGAGAAALVGSLSTLGLVYALSQRGGFLDPVTLVLVGVIVSVMCGAATMFVAMLLPDRGFGVARWTIGALDDNVTPTRLWIIGSVTLTGVVMASWAGRAMDAAALTEDEARSVGVPIGGLRLLQFVLAGTLTAGAVVLAGPIGFVGLVCPHVVRLMAGPAHRVLVIGSALAGAAMVVGADALVKAVDLAGGRMPIGVLTAMLGGPVLILLLRSESIGRRGE
jgi:iron complex transport system permease protein